MIKKISTIGKGSLFEKAKHTQRDGLEYWSARELMPLLGYIEWRKFEGVIQKAKTACSESRHDTEDHFVGSDKMVEIGSGSRRKVDDYHLSRYACYLIAQNGSPTKSEIALAQTYFAAKTHQREVDEELVAIEERKEHREILKRANKELASNAKLHGVVAGLDFAIFADAGNKGLYGMGANDLKKLRGINKTENLQDHMGTTELGLNIAKAVIAKEKLHSIPQQGKAGANLIHEESGAAVREMVEKFGITAPENLPLEEDIKHVARRLEKSDDKILIESHKNIAGEKVVEILLPNYCTQEHLVKIKDILKSSQGNGRVTLDLKIDAQNTKRIHVPFGVRFSKEVEKQIKNIFN